jgi:hypothetical protein
MFWSLGAILTVMTIKGNFFVLLLHVGKEMAMPQRNPSCSDKEKVLNIATGNQNLIENTATRAIKYLACM